MTAAVAVGSRRRRTELGLILLAMLINAFDFPLYLIAGGMIAGWDAFAPAMIAEAKRRSFTFRTEDTRVAMAELGNEAGLYGAAYLPFCE